MKLKKSSKTALGATAGLAVNGSSSSSSCISGGGGGVSQNRSVKFKKKKLHKNYNHSSSSSNGSGGSSGGGSNGGGVVGSSNGGNSGGKDSSNNSINSNSSSSNSSSGINSNSSNSNSSSNRCNSSSSSSGINSNSSSSNSNSSNSNSSNSGINSNSSSNSSSSGKLKKKWTKRKKGKENNISSSSNSSNVNNNNNSSSSNSSSSSVNNNNNSSSNSSVIKGNSSSSSVNNNNNNKRFHVPTEPSECSSNWKLLCQTVNMNAPNDPNTTTTSPHTKKRKKSYLVPDSLSRVTGRQGGVLLRQPSKRGRTGEASRQKDHHHHHHNDDDHDDDDDNDDDEDEEGPRMDEEEEAGIEPGTLPESVESDTQLVQHSANDRPTTCVALDCEMVGTGPGGQSDMLARVSVVNQYGHCLYDTYVAPMDDVTDYRTRFSGVTPRLLENGKDFKTVISEVGNMLKDRIVVGHALHNDLKVLYLTHPKSLQRDTSKYGPFRRLHHNKTPSLRFLSQRLLGITIQQAAHSSVIDAQAAMRLYMGHRKEWEARRRRKRKSKAGSKLRLKRKEKEKKRKKAVVG